MIRNQGLPGALLVALGMVVTMPALAEESKPRKRFDTPVSASTLEKGRGGALNVQSSDQRLASTVAGHAAIDVVTGSNTISEGAFGNSQGLPMLIQNTGNNVSIQNATVINVTIK